MGLANYSKHLKKILAAHLFMDRYGNKLNTDQKIDYILHNVSSKTTE